MREPRLADQFADLGKQAHAARLGMWAFLGSELLLFGGLFALYGGYRAMYGAEFAEAAAHNSRVLGTVNTLVLITSSFTVALAVHAVREDRPRSAARLLGITLALGATFLIIKGFEYAAHFREGIFPGEAFRAESLPGVGPRLFFTLYYMLTGLHALHVIAGMTFIGWLCHQTRRKVYGPASYTPLELGGLYWHLVDVVWIFLWPLLYLTR